MILNAHPAFNIRGLMNLHNITKNLCFPKTKVFVMLFFEVSFVLVQGDRMCYFSNYSHPSRKRLNISQAHCLVTCAASLWPLLSGLDFLLSLTLGLATGLALPKWMWAEVMYLFPRTSFGSHCVIQPPFLFCPHKTKGWGPRDRWNRGPDQQSCPWPHTGMLSCMENKHMSL